MCDKSTTNNQLLFICVLERITTIVIIDLINCRLWSLS